MWKFDKAVIKTLKQKVKDLEHQLQEAVDKAKSQRETLEEIHHLVTTELANIY